jgi:hypothetical protein
MPSNLIKATTILTILDRKDGNRSVMKKCQSNSLTMMREGLPESSVSQIYQIAATEQQEVDDLLLFFFLFEGSYD